MKPKDEWHIGQLRQVFPGLAAGLLACYQVDKHRRVRKIRLSRSDLFNDAEMLRPYVLCPSARSLQASRHALLVSRAHFVTAVRPYLVGASRGA